MSFLFLVGVGCEGESLSCVRALIYCKIIRSIERVTEIGVEAGKLRDGKGVNANTETRELLLELFQQKHLKELL